MIYKGRNHYPFYLLALLLPLQVSSKNWFAQYRDTQNIAPRTERCGAKLKLNGEQLLILAELIEASDDATLQELRYLLYQKIGFTISRATMGRMAKLLNMTLKKNYFLLT